VAPELRSTYRLMFGETFRFAEATALIPYLVDLGVSHVYLPPSFQARAGSAHGYDVVDPGSLSSELGGEEGFRALCDAAHAAGLGVVLDIVPNHMATDDANRFWTDQREQYFDVQPETGFYRRFFDIDHLAGVRVEDPEVFEATHALTLRLLREGWIDGVRIDHPDGLADPLGYLERLEGAPAWVEKILDPGEKLRPDWPVEGTVGYEFLNDVGALFVDPAGEAPLTALWHEISGDTRAFEAWATEAKLEQAEATFAREVEWLRNEWPGCPLSVREIACGLSSLPVYRTYIRDGVASEEDRKVLREANVEWLLDAPDAFVTRFQQTTPPVMAKGVEDTAFYRYARLVSLNDVGGDPSRFGISVDAFHAANAEREATHPRNLLITSTHDTKRSGDARARAGAIASMPEAWREWALPRIDECFPAVSYFLLQNLAAVGRISDDRIDTFVEKALREMKQRSSWAAPDEAFEADVKAWARAVDLGGEFLSRLAAVGDRHALGQVLLKLTSPGVPDIYHGDEVQDLALVDPDNRRPIDWDRVRRGDAKTELIRTVLAQRVTGAYEPIDAGDDVVAFRRGRHTVAVALREGAALPALEGEVVYAGDGMELRAA
jgi:(1->4)-alpha-D-glucan 1-alpha-D-glucosylmutase